MWNASSFKYVFIYHIFKSEARQRSFHSMQLIFLIKQNTTLDKRSAKLMKNSNRTDIKVKI